MLNNVSFTIPKGKKVALVGASGSGKCTIAKLLLKYYEPETGEITIDGVDINEFTNASLRRSISYVPQNIELFSKSIYDNIRVSKMNATLDEVKEAAKAADAHDFIKKLPMQYYTFLEEAGNGLSGGEKQRIALAKAFLKKNEFYILDESTSNLDFATENIIFDMIYNKFRKKSMLIIAHRLATVKNCDEIIVMNQGEIVEQGSHEELLARKGEYYKLWEMQQGNFVALAIDIGCALAGIYASACGELLGRGVIALIKVTWKKCNKKVAAVLGTTVCSAIGVGIGKLNKVAGMIISCLSFGGIIGLGLDALDGQINSRYTW